MKLYELTDNYKSILNDDSLDPQAATDTLDAIKDDIRVKADSIASMIDELKSQAKRKKDKAKSWRESATADENKARWLQQYLTDELDNAGIKKMETDNHLLNVRNYKQSVVVDDLNGLPQQFVEEKTSYMPNKKAIYQALRKGNVPGAHLKKNRSVTIK